MEFISYDNYNQLERRRKNQHSDYSKFDRGLHSMEIGELLMVERSDIFDDSVTYKKAYQSIYSRIYYVAKRNYKQYTTKSLVDGWVIERIK